MKVKTNEIEKFLKENNLAYERSLYTLEIYNYRNKYKVVIDLQFGDYLMAKYLDNSYICEVECKTQDRVISLLSGY